MYGFGNFLSGTTRKPTFDFKLAPALTTPAVFNFADMANLANLAGYSGKLDAFMPTTTTTTKAAGFNLASLFGATSPASGTNSNSILSLLSLLSSMGINTGSLASITPFLSLLPLDQLLPSNNPQASLGLISSLPQIISLIQSFNNFKFPTANVIK